MEESRTLERLELELGTHQYKCCVSFFKTMLLRILKELWVERERGVILGECHMWRLGRKNKWKHVVPWQPSESSILRRKGSPTVGIGVTDAADREKMKTRVDLGGSTEVTGNFVERDLRGDGNTVLCSVAQSCPIICDPMDCSPPGSSVLGDSPGKNIGVGFYALLQGNLPSPGIEPGSLALQADSLPADLPGKPSDGNRPPEIREN